ncbi:MAG TPA: ComEC/Rec2 family competence protein [Gemmatimonadales bacterium]|nr:ComEC/Rec2 family competence protein [Gemmatimonadales bacterium]
MTVRFAVALWLLACPVAAQHLEIRFLDVGQGDATLIREGGRTVLIDAGPSPAIASYLREFHVDTIDLLIASHNHSDHIGGMTTVLGSAFVRFYVDNGLPSTTSTYERTIEAVQASGAQYLHWSDRSITLGDAVVHLLPPPPQLTDDQNNGSVGVLIEYGQFLALFTGDSQQQELSAWLSGGDVPRVSVLKVAHHGSSNGTSPAWIRATRPQVAVISVGSGNSYGHPAASVIADWEQAGARVFRTDRDGSVVVFANFEGGFVVTTANAYPKGVIEFQPLEP